MKCLKCGQDRLPLDTVTCPNPACRVHLPSLMRDMLPPGTLLRDGAYKIDYALGQGGFGITYRGFSLLFDEPVAIKEFFPQTLAMRESDSGRLMVPTTEAASFDRWQERFLREGRMLRQLSQPMPHPHVVQVKDLFEEKGTAYLVMELVDGKSLGEELEQRPGECLSEGETKRVMAGLVDALSAVHKQSIYHLDLKPDNVLLRPNGEPVLVDFGAARYGLERATMKRKRSSSRAFTLNYAPPELLAGEELGPQSDIFELGMMLHELLTGKLPPGVLSRNKEEVWEPSAIGEPWKGLISEALRYTRTQRPHSASAWWTQSHGASTARMPASAPPRPEASPKTSSAAAPQKIGTTAVTVLGSIVVVTVVGLAGAVGYLVAQRLPSERPTPSAIREAPIEPPSPPPFPIPSASPSPPPPSPIPYASPSPPPPSPPVQPRFPSALGINYSYLQQLLVAQQFGAAEVETGQLIIRLQDAGYPCTDLRTLDRLWSASSNGRFGLGIQLEIWRSVGRDINGFKQRVGWVAPGRRFVQGDLQFSLNALRGHLPWLQPVKHASFLPRVAGCL